VIQGSILGEKPFVLSEAEFRALRIVDDGRPSVREAIVKMGVAPQCALASVPLFRRLGELGALDFHG
jgi:hypothetical protein